MIITAKIIFYFNERKLMMSCCGVCGGGKETMHNSEKNKDVEQEQLNKDQPSETVNKSESSEGK